MTASGTAATDTPDHAGDAGAGGAPDTGVGPDRSARAALGVFVALAVATFLLVVFHLGRDRWFFSDEWNLLATREPGSFHDLLRPNNAHWTTNGTIAYDVVWRLFGVRTYVPYQAMSVLSHLFVVVMARIVMRRAGVNPWLATAACCSLLLLAAGADNIVWAFQITNTGAVAFGMVQLVLADHDGPVDRRDGLALAAGLMALMCNGIGVTMVGVVGLAVLVRRGWRPALLQTVPLAAAQGLWTLYADPQSTGPGGRPTIGTVASWVVRFVEGTFTGLGTGAVLGWVFAAVVVVGVALTLADNRWTEARARLAAPVALAVGALVFSASTALGRWHFGTEAAASNRYVYTGAALVLPLVAVGAQAIVERWRPALPLLAVAFLLPVPLNVRDFDDPTYGEVYFGFQRRIISSAAYAPFADEVPDDVRPLPNPFIPDEVDMGYLRAARDAGTLDPPALPLSPRTVEELRVRLGLAQRKAPAPVLPQCTELDEPIVTTLPRGTEIALRTPIDVIGIGPDGTRGRVVTYLPVNGGLLTAELDDLQIEVRRWSGAQEGSWCGPS